MARAIQIFLNCDLRCCHEGLAEVAKKNKIDVKKLNPGEFVIFINASKNRLKLYTANNVIAYLKLQENQKIDLRVIALIPQAFEATGKINYDENLKKVIEKELSKK